MKIEQVYSEYHKYKLNETQAEDVSNLYKAAATVVVSITGGSTMAVNKLVLKTTMNVLKLLVIQLFEFKGEEDARREKIQNC